MRSASPSLSPSSSRPRCTADDPLVQIPTSSSRSSRRCASCSAPSPPSPDSRSATPSSLRPSQFIPIVPHLRQTHRVVHVFLEDALFEELRVEAPRTARARSPSPSLDAARLSPRSSLRRSLRSTSPTRRSASAPVAPVRPPAHAPRPSCPPPTDAPRLARPRPSHRLFALPAPDDQLDSHARRAQRQLGRRQVASAVALGPSSRRARRPEPPRQLPPPRRAPARCAALHQDCQVAERQDRAQGRLGRHPRCVARPCSLSSRPASLRPAPARVLILLLIQGPSQTSGRPCAPRSLARTARRTRSSTSRSRRASSASLLLLVLSPPSSSHRDFLASRVDD